MRQTWEQNSEAEWKRRGIDDSQRASGERACQASCSVGSTTALGTVALKFVPRLFMLARFTFPVRSGRARGASQVCGEIRERRVSEAL